MRLEPYPAASLPSPQVDVIFKGLLVIEPSVDSKSCKVGIHYDTNGLHDLSIVITGQKPNGELFLISKYRGERLNGPFAITVDPPTNQGVFGFEPAGPNGFDRSTNVDGRDIRWAVDLQNKREFHDYNLRPLAASVEPCITMTDGVFYTFDRSDKNAFSIQRRRHNETLDLHRIATVIAAVISPPAGHVVLTSQDLPASLRLPRAEDPPETTYTVSVRNEPLMITGGSSHDELAEYYKVVAKNSGQLVPANEQFRLEMAQLDAFDGDKIPCMSVFVGD